MFFARPRPFRTIDPAGLCSFKNRKLLINNRHLTVSSARRCRRRVGSFQHLPVRERSCQIWILNLRELKPFTFWRCDCFFYSSSCYTMLMSFIHWALFKFIHSFIQRCKHIQCETRPLVYWRWTRFSRRTQLSIVVLILISPQTTRPCYQRPQPQPQPQANQHPCSTHHSCLHCPHITTVSETEEETGWYTSSRQQWRWCYLVVDIWLVEINELWVVRYW